MKLSLKTSLTVNDTQSNYIGHMVYAAFKLWNICNYERRNYKDLNLGKYPDWYYQKSITDYLHKMTRAIVEYCKSNDIHTVVIGDITGIRKNANLGHKTNQKLHGLPYVKIYLMLEYKLALYGIRFVKQKEAYSSQCSPYSKKVSKTYATAKNRVKRGLYIDSTKCFNADAVGAYNILRIYLTKNRINTEIPVSGIQSPYIFKVAA